MKEVNSDGRSDSSGLKGAREGAIWHSGGRVLVFSNYSPSIQKVELDPHQKDPRSPGVLNHRELVKEQWSIPCASLPLPSVLTRGIPLGPRGVDARAGLHPQPTWKNHRAWLPIPWCSLGFRSLKAVVISISIYFLKWIHEIITSSVLPIKWNYLRAFKYACAGSLWLSHLISL